MIANSMYVVFRIRMNIEGLNPTVKHFKDTVMHIQDKKASVSRFGDGEFKWMFQNREDGNFEINSPKLAEALNKTINDNNEKLMICIPDVFNGLSQYNAEAREYWGICLGRYGISWLRSMNLKRVYFDTQFTRPYMDYRNKKDVPKKFDVLKQIWNDRDVLIVEGNKTRFGIGNDLLSNAKSVRRILAPATNAFEKYEDIKKLVLDKIDNSQNTLVLISLGPTATVLAAELASVGKQAIDIGHLDIEYSWYLMRAEKKLAVDGKYVNEVPDGGYSVNDIKSRKWSLKYHSEIIGNID